MRTDFRASLPYMVKWKREEEGDGDWRGWFRASVAGEETKPRRVGKLGT